MPAIIVGFVAFVYFLCLNCLIYCTVEYPKNSLIYIYVLACRSVLQLSENL